jgi:uncharacterized protein YaaW (UPF0174 family)
MFDEMFLSHNFLNNIGQIYQAAVRDKKLNLHNSSIPIYLTKMLEQMISEILDDNWNTFKKFHFSHLNQKRRELLMVIN